MIIELRSKSVFVQVDTKGAQLLSVKDVVGTEYMWQRDGKYWAKTSPFLFPIVGNLRDGKTVIEGKEYQIGKHGFCREAEFSVLYQDVSSAKLCYRWNEETLKQYPYRFSVMLTYTVSETGVDIRYDIQNVGDGDMLYCFGAHPAFNTPVDGEGGFTDCVVEFPQKETAAAIRYDLKALEFDKSDRRPMLNDETTWNLQYCDFDNDAVVFDSLKSDSVRLYNRLTGRGVEVAYPGFEFLAFWTPIGLNAPFLCIEPWCGMAVCKDEDMDYAHKYGVKTLPECKQDTYHLTITLL